MASKRDCGVARLTSDAAVEAPLILETVYPSCLRLSIFTASPFPLHANPRATGNLRTHTICSPLSAIGQLGRCSAGVCFSANNRFNLSSEPVCIGQKRSPGRQLRITNSRPSISALNRLLVSVVSLASSSGMIVVRNVRADLGDIDLARNGQHTHIFSAGRLGDRRAGAPDTNRDAKLSIRREARSWLALRGHSGA